MLRIFWALQFVFYLIFRLGALGYVYDSIGAREVFVGQYAVAKLSIELTFIGLMILGGLYSLRFRHLPISKEGVFGNFLVAGFAAIEMMSHPHCITLF